RGKYRLENLPRHRTRAIPPRHRHQCHRPPEFLFVPLLFLLSESLSGLLRLMPSPAARPRYAMSRAMRQSKTAETLPLRRPTSCEGRARPAPLRPPAWRGPGCRARLPPEKTDRTPPGATPAGHAARWRAARRPGLAPADIAPPGF